MTYPRISFATAAGSPFGGAGAPGHGRDNEDWVGALPHAVVVLDGAGVPPGMDTGCTHGAAWYAAELGRRLLDRIGAHREIPLPDALAEAIAGLAADHGLSCDVGHPGTPSATVAAVRFREREADWLVLSDATVLLDDGHRVEAVCDRRNSAVSPELSESNRRHVPGEPAHEEALRHSIAVVREQRNRPGGFWIASADPAAAHHAYTGSRPRAGLRRVALLTDGVTRLVDMFGVAGWTDLLGRAERAGPGALLDEVRAWELRDPRAARWPRIKVHDDATAALCLP
ncbi:protein phosphatase 2C domain-containing protein [Streptomyces sp. LHD-70]|uniref:protein phosphatase 2C domain-containing protein n=1 Tax=Streptomyces sp. LHD-70 TaxID=3072140 RepID=UPI00280D074F|nr:protein phosphatase 2C domain-containing protein [Streptomyces sp. LHD-70]MDQ8706961.1 protein phosphatase 2C domain-containing protein [Streptomyces sp. LHD-70]